MLDIVAAFGAPDSVALYWNLVFSDIVHLFSLSFPTWWQVGFKEERIQEYIGEILFTELKTIHIYTQWWLNQNYAHSPESKGLPCSHMDGESSMYIQPYEDFDCETC